MKFDPVFTGRLKRDLTKMLASGKEERRFKDIARKLINGERLDPKHRDHKLIATMWAAANVTSRQTGCLFTR
jgi:mRNA-degrading endonuclease YafQ of YafQ-DinJ toxin-antitoxin module